MRRIRRRCSKRRRRAERCRSKSPRSTRPPPAAPSCRTRSSPRSRAPTSWRAWCTGSWPSAAPARTRTKGMSEVSGTTKKPYRQKGTGNARQGSLRAPQFRTGGVVHGPVVALARLQPEQEGAPARPDLGAVAEAGGRQAGGARRGERRGEDRRTGEEAEGAGLALGADRRSARWTRASCAPAATSPASTCCRRSAPMSTTS